MQIGAGKNQSWSVTTQGTYDVYDVTHGTVYYPSTLQPAYTLRMASNYTDSANTPNFRKLRKKPENSYYKYEVTLDQAEIKWVLEERMWRPPPESWQGQMGYWNHVRQTWTIQKSGVPLFVPGPLEADDPTQRVVSKINEMIRLGQADLGTTLAEAGKTAKFVAETATRIANSLRALKRFDLGGMSKALGITTTRRQVRRFSRRRREYLDMINRVPLKDRKKFEKASETHYWNFMSQTWLEYSYAWKPLLNDVYSLAKATAEAMVERGPDVRYVRAKANTERIVAEKPSSPNWRGWINQDTFQSRKYVSMKIGYTVNGGGASFAVAFGLDNPLRVAWELVPFSFVADWFIPIGTALDSLSVSNGLTFYEGTKTTRHHQSVVRSVYGGNSSSNSATYQAVGSGRGVGKSTGFQMNRVHLFSFPSYGFPSFRDPRSLAHGASAIALLQSIFLRR